PDPLRPGRLDSLRLLDVADGDASLEDDPLAAAGGDADIRLLGLAEAVDQAAEDADPQRVLEPLHPLLDLGDDPLQVDVQPAAGRGGDDLRLVDPTAGGAEDVEAGLDLRHRVAQQAHADRVADAPQQDRPDPRGAL